MAVDRSALGRKSRRKGAVAERELCAMLRDHLGGDYTRNLKQYQKSQEGDVAQLVGPYLIEAKNCATTNLKAWWQQAVTAANKRGAIPCVAYKVARKGWLFVVPLPHAWSSGHQWGRELQYTMTLFPDGFYLLVRETR